MRPECQNGHECSDPGSQYCLCHRDAELAAVMTESERFLAICRKQTEPDAAAYKRGHDDHAAGKGFHEGPRPLSSVEALSWRIGWNDRALAHP